MQCPECGSRQLRVVLTTNTKEKEVVRRRRCLRCDHRWYTLQPPERVLEGMAVSWSNRGAVTLV